VGDGAGAGLLGVVDEVTLGVVVRLLADDLDGVLVGPDRAVGPQAEKDGPHDVVRLDVQLFNGQGQVGDVIDDADGEVVPGPVLGQLVEDGLDHGRRELLGGQPVAAADDVGLAGQGSDPLVEGLAQGGHDVHVERLADGTGLLGAVEHGDGPGGGG